MNSTNHHALAVLATFLIGASTANLHAASFSDDNWSNIGNILSEEPFPRLSGGVWAVATDGSSERVKPHLCSFAHNRPGYGGESHEMARQLSIQYPGAMCRPPAHDHEAKGVR